VSDELMGRNVLRVGAAVAGWFVRPAPVAAVDGAHPTAGTALVAPVVLAGADGQALGVGAALALAQSTRGVVVLACWRVPGAQRRGGLATGAARRLVGSLDARGVEAAATGRLVVVALPDDARDAIVQLRRVESACGSAACVPVLGGARDAAWDEVLVERGVALLHAAERSVLQLAAERLAAQGVEARVLTTTPGPIGRALAVGGWRPPGARGLCRALEPA
jgi:hypothetical protein